MPTSVTGERQRANRARRGHQGFSLVELLVAFAVLALVMGVMPFAVSKFHESAEYRSTERQMRAMLIEARRQAVGRGVSVAFEVDLHGRSFGLEGAVVQRMPADLQLRLDVAANELDSGRRARIRFYPDGGATGGSIDILRPGGGGARLRVDWLLGRVSQEPLS